MYQTHHAATDKQRNTFTLEGKSNVSLGSTVSNDQKVLKAYSVIRLKGTVFFQETLGRVFQ
jgi:hypothetical protein